MERPRQSTIFFATAAASVAAYELMCDRDELITSRTQETMDTPFKRALIMSAIGMTSLHLAGYLHPSLDPYHYAGKLRHLTRPNDA